MTPALKVNSLLVVKVCVFAALVGWVIGTQDLNEIWVLVVNASYIYFPLFFVFNALGVALSSFNVFLLLRPLGKRMEWRRVFYFDRLSLVGGHYTPGGVGGLGMMVYLMARDGVGLKDSAVVVFVNKLVTLLVALLFLPVYVFVYHGGNIDIKFHWLLVFGLAAAAIAVAILISTKVRQSVQKIAARLWCYSGQVPLLLGTVVVTVCIFSFASMQFLVAFSAVGVNVDDGLLILVTYGLLLLINYLPITFGGIGLGEAAAVVLWSGLGITSEQILAGYLVMRVFVLLSTLLLGGSALVVWLLERHRHADVQ